MKEAGAIASVGAMDQRDDLHQLLVDLFAQEALAVLATSENDRPHASLVAVAARDDLKQVVFATPRATRKYTNLQANPNASLLVDDTTGSPSDFHNAMAVTIQGTAAEPTGAERPAAARLLTDRHPHLQGFVEADSCAVMVMDVEEYRIVRQFQNVVIYNPNRTD